jgi:TDG/mug DNA glycosylase family protein
LELGRRDIWTEIPTHSCRTRPTMNTLPDYLQPGLDIVLIGLNPGLSSVEIGHYFAFSRNRFWPAINGSGLLPEALDAENDHRMLEFGIGFTDVVKRPTAGSSDLRAADYREWAPVLQQKLELYKPRIAVFHGATAYRNYLRYAESINQKPSLGLQELRIGASQVFLLPNPSPANAVYSLDDLTGWYVALRELRDEPKAVVN